MTLPATTRRAGPFDGNDSTTVFPFTFKVFATDELVVYLTDTEGAETVLTLDSDYSVTLNSDQDDDPGGDITYPLSGSPLATGEKLTAIGGLPYDQTLDIPDGGNFNPVTIENALDRTVMQVQQLEEIAARALVIPAGSEASAALPAAEASKLLGWNSLGTAIINYVANAVGAASTFMATLLGAASALAARAYLKMYGVYVTDFGTLGAGNDAAVLQAAIDYVEGTTALILIPPNTTIALGATGVTSTGAVRIVGEGGRDRTYITWTSTTMTAWAHTAGATGGLQMEGVTMYGPASCTAGGAISINGSGGVANAGTKIKDCTFVNGFVQINAPQAHSWEITGNRFTDYVSKCLHTENTVDQDEGDAYFTNNALFASGAASVGVYQAGAGGLKVIGNKIFGGQYGYLMELAAGANTSILILQGNSIEFQTLAGVCLRNTAGTASFTMANINGNQFAGTPTPILLDDPVGFLVGTSISDNTIGAKTGAGTTCAITVTCAPLTKITDNIIYGTGSTVLGISIGSGSFATSEYGNEIYGCVTEVVNNCSNGVASAATITLPTWTDTIIVTGTTNISAIATASNHRNRTVTLVFQGSLTVSDAGNLLLAGAFAATQHDTLTLTCADGTYWYEVARSVN